jgi:hypothetical protein
LQLLKDGLKNRSKQLLAPAWRLPAPDAPQVRH